MSLVYITHHNENVMDYEKVGYVEASVKKLKYTSVHKAAVTKKMNQPYITHAPDGRLLITDSGKHERRTMGSAVIPLAPTKCFLRKNQGLKWKRLHDHKCPEKRNLPPIPKVSELPPKKICPPKVKAKSEQVMETEEPPLEELKIVIECPEITIDPCKAYRAPQCDPCQSVRAAKPCETVRETSKTKPCESVREFKETSRAKPCETVREIPKQRPCGSEREFKDRLSAKPYGTAGITSRSKTCASAREPKATSRPKPSASAREIRVTATEQPYRTKGGFEKPKDNRSVRSAKSVKSEAEDIDKSNDPCKTKNFIALNIKRIKNSRPQLPPPRYVDTPCGETHNLLNSGLLPQFICGRNFAKVPCYIEEHRKLIKKYKEECAPEIMATQDCSEFLKKQGVRKMTLEERVALLAGLKANYMEQLKIFQTLSLYTDTPTKKLRKGRLEKDLDQLEMDIKFIQDNVDIYVSEF